ncbi:glucose 1-dehydrogenase [Aquitalea sp. S1-19]|nr:glucose 1-dehydrogenase [Aquitalea sp. S1-19]
MNSMLERFSLQGEVAIITGAGRGIGRAIALAFAEAGADVVCVARNQSEIDDTAKAAREFGIRALALSCDVNNDAALQRLVDDAREAMGKLTLLVNNAGGAGPNHALKTTAKAFDDAMHFNVTTAFRLSALVAPHMQAAGHGVIINITSAAARYAQKNFTVYGAAKAALTQLNRLLAQDFAPVIRVNAIAPGPIRTEALAQFLNDDARQKMIDATPLQSLGEAEDIAAAALFLASPASRWITGKVIEVDGGAESTVWPF